MREAKSISYTVIFFGIILCLTLAWATNALSSTTTSLKIENNWLDQASLLVLAAQQSDTDAQQFNKEVRTSRAQLRQLMQQARQKKLSSELRQLHSSMLLLDVLLKSAAACQTAGYIACPPLLISQLKTVLKNAYANRDRVEQALNQSKAGQSQ